MCLNLSEQTEGGRVCEYGGNPELCSPAEAAAAAALVGHEERTKNHASAIHCKNIKHVPALYPRRTAHSLLFVQYLDAFIVGGAHLKILLEWILPLETGQILC